ncbi:MAG: HYExAFE family protein [Phycisphaerae bacterium]|nr:HYExAFE family protein [Phycisphaerae bacterium]
MQSEQPNIYEQVFACWLQENHIPFVDVDQTKRFGVERQDVKNFDFLIRPDSQNPLLVEVKGRTFHSGSLAGLKALDGWVTFEDVEALVYWRGCFQSQKPQAEAVFVFVFALEQIDVETDGQAVYDFGDRRFLLLAMPLAHYRACMKPRSPKWQTVTVPAEDFRRYAVPIEETLKGKTKAEPRKRPDKP